MTFPLFVGKFINSLETEKHYSNHTCSNYKRDLDQFYEFLIQNNINSFVDLDRNEARMYLRFLKDQAYHSRTISRKISSLRSFWTYLIHIGQLSVNPWKGIRLPKTAQTLPKLPSEDKINQFLDALPITTFDQIRDKAIFELLYSSGLRVSECVALDETDILWKKYEMKVKGKGNQERIAFFGDQATIWLQEYCRQVRVKWITPREKALFLNQKGTRITTRSIQRLFKKYSQQFDLNLTPHMLRHGMATSLLNGGAGLRDIQEILGHKRLSTTQIYTHLSLDRITKTFHKLHPRSL